MRSSLSSRAALLFALLSSTASVASALPSSIFARASTCGVADYTQCTQTGLPDNFCCPAGDTCVSLAGNTTVLCCPAGADCSVLEPIPCDITLEDKTLHADNTIMTTALAGSLGHCGTGMCCPFGYSCNTDGNCAQDADQNAVPIQSSSASSAAATATSTTAGTATTGTTTSTAANSVIPVSTHTAASSASSTSSSTAAPAASGSTKSGPSGKAVAGGIVGGLAGAALLALLAFMLIRWRMRKNEEQEKSLKLHRSTSSFGNIINNPMTSVSSSTRRPNISKPFPHPLEGFAERHDFVRSPPHPRPSPGSINSYDTNVHVIREGSLDLDGGLSPPPPRVPGYGALSFDTSNRGDQFDPPARMPRARDHGGDDAQPIGRSAYNSDRSVSPASGNASDVIDVQLDTERERDHLKRISNQTTFTDMIYQMEHADLVARHGYETPPMPPMPKRKP